MFVKISEFLIYMYILQLIVGFTYQNNTRGVYLQYLCYICVILVVKFLNWDIMRRFKITYHYYEVIKNLTVTLSKHN